MSNIYVPIDFSEVGSVVPEGEDIVYSTICHVKQRGGTGPTSFKKSYNSHVVLTTNGIAFEVKRKVSKTQCLYIPYVDAGPNLIISPKNNFYTRVGTYRFQLKHSKDFESSEQFNERKQVFSKTMAPFYIKALEKNIQESPPGWFTKRKKKHLQKFKSKM